MLFPNINFLCWGNINEDLNFEYGDETEVTWGCGATLQNVFWYFGGPFESKRRQVKLQKKNIGDSLFGLYYQILGRVFRQVKLLDASWSAKPIWTLILKKVHATPSINRIQKSFFASIRTIANNATRE